MKKILLIATVYRVGERIYSTIPELSKFANLDLLLINQMSPKCTWYGDDDPRVNFHKLYDQYFNTIHDAGMHSTDASPSPVLLDIDINQYDLILYDDNRDRHGISNMYNTARANSIPMVGCVHGAGKSDMDGIGGAYDYLLTFGNKESKLYKSHPKIRKIGIPSNDILTTYTQTKEHILVIVNYLGNRSCPFPIQVDGYFISQVGLKQLQDEFNKKIVFKLKSRQDHPYPEKDIEYLRNIIKGELDYKIIIDGNNDKLIAESFIVISAPSTLAFKSIQLGIPTVLIKGTQGHSIYFDDFKGLVNLNTQTIFDEIQRQYDHGKDTQFILDNIEGGLEFNSTNYFINSIKEIIK